MKNTKSTIAHHIPTWIIHTSIADIGIASKRHLGSVVNLLSLIVFETLGEFGEVRGILSATTVNRLENY